MFSKKKTPVLVPVSKPAEPTLEQRLSMASAAAVSATHIFRVAAENLDKASDELDVVASAAEAEADRLLSIVEDALSKADASRVQASKLRSALGEN